MYKCTECGQEYTQKPEYCDCGNNIFEQEVESIQQPQNNAAAQKETDIKQDYAVREIVNTSSGRVDNKSLAISRIFKNARSIVTLEHFFSSIFVFILQKMIDNYKLRIFVCINFYTSIITNDI